MRSWMKRPTICVAPMSEIAIPLQYESRFRSPLNSILGLERVAAGGMRMAIWTAPTNPAGGIRPEGRRKICWNWVNDLLDLAKVEAGKVEAKPVDFTVANLFAALRGMLRALAAQSIGGPGLREEEGIPSGCFPMKGRSRKSCGISFRMR